jgi:hypothetical protein
MTTLARILAALTVVTLLAAGCSTTINGAAVKAPGAGGGDGVDLALLNVGNYPTTPRPPLGVAGEAREGGWAEARRMATNIVGPWEVDPSLSGYAQSDTGVIKGPDGVNALLGAPLGDGLAGHKLVAGFSSARHTNTGPYKGLLNLVSELDTPADAAAAVAVMAAHSDALTLPFDTKPIPTQHFSIPRHPATAAVSYRWTSSYPNAGEARFSVTAITAHGQYLLAQTATSADNPDLAAQLVATTLDLQQPLIDTFKPTPYDQLAQLPLDPNGLLAHTLPPRSENETVNDGVYDAHGALHLEPDDPVHLQALFKSVGLQQAAELIEQRVYQTPDAESAARIVADMSGPRRVGGITGMPKANCFTETLASWCIAGADRYAYFIQNEQEAALHQMMAAQYRMLTGK